MKLELMKKEDGFWLSIKVPSGKCALINIGELDRIGIVGDVLREATGKE